MMIGLGQEGSASAPTCFAGEQVTVFDDGSYGCAATLNAQSFGNPSPACAGAYIDPSTSDWACPPPPVQQSSGVGTLVFAVLIAAVAFWYFGGTAAKSVDKVSRGKFDDFLPSLPGVKS